MSELTQLLQQLSGEMTGSLGDLMDSLGQAKSASQQRDDAMRQICYCGDRVASCLLIMDQPDYAAIVGDKSMGVRVRQISTDLIKLPFFAVQQICIPVVDNLLKLADRVGEEHTHMAELGLDTTLRNIRVLAKSYMEDKVAAGEISDEEVATRSANDTANHSQVATSSLPEILAELRANPQVAK